MTTGTAYGFFDCRAPIREIGSHLPNIRYLSRVPQKVGISLKDGVKELGRGLRYVMRATYPNATNETAAFELVPVLNQAYQSPLYRDREPFRGGIIHEKDGGYEIW